jgi:hypothetical protein
MMDSAGNTPVIPAVLAAASLGGYSGAPIMSPLGEITYHELRHATASRHWLWHGYVGPGQITLLSSQWKMGKTSLLALLIARRREGGTLAGLTVTAGPSAVVSEEPADLWGERGQQLGFRGDTTFFCRPFLGKPTAAQLESLCVRLLELRAANGTDLAVFDPLSHFLPRGAENNADLLLDAAPPLRRLAEAGMAVTLLHHVRKGTTAPGLGARGSGALGANVDVLLEMTPAVPHEPKNRRRALRAWSRYPETRLFQLLELAEDGSDYRQVEVADDDPMTDHWPALRVVLEDAKKKLRRSQILEEWPSDFIKPSPMTLFRLLDSVVSKGLVRRDGAGRRRDPYRYWLAENEERIVNNWLNQLEENSQEQMRKLEVDCIPREQVEGKLG